jgi:hypothetical protein
MFIRIIYKSSMHCDECALDLGETCVRSTDEGISSIENPIQHTRQTLHCTP